LPPPEYPPEYPPDDEPRLKLAPEWLIELLSLRRLNELLVRVPVELLPLPRYCVPELLPRYCEPVLLPDDEPRY
jgi:hypothetical protein